MITIKRHPLPCTAAVFSVRPDTVRAAPDTVSILPEPAARAGQCRDASLNIDLYTALLGGEVVLQLTGGQRIKLRVKPETQNGTKVRLRGKGYDRGDGTMGDMIITYNVTLPTNLNDKQKQLLRQMQQGG